jgi:hypothetical protein
LYAFQIIYVGEIVLSLTKADAPHQLEEVATCNSHDYTQHTIHLQTLEKDCHDRGIETIPLHDSPYIQMCYSSMHSSIHTFVDLGVINNRTAETLAVVHLQFEIEGKVTHETLEADDHLRYVFEWDKHDVFGQRVTGMSLLVIKAGYEYTDCKKVIWTTRSILVHGFAPIRDNIMGWGLNKHHRILPESHAFYMGNKNQAFDLRKGSRQLRKLPSQAGHIVAVAYDGMQTTFFGDGKSIYKLSKNGAKVCHPVSILFNCSV